MAPSWAVKPAPTVADSARPDQRRDLAGVEVRRDEGGEVGDAELVERRVALQADVGAGEEGEEGDDADRAADQGERAAAQADLGQQAHDLLLVAEQDAVGPADGARVERQLRAEVVEGAQRLAGHLLHGPGRPLEPGRELSAESHVSRPSAGRPGSRSP
jgi:hypothetical protein